VTTKVAFGRSGTVAVSKEGACLARQVTALEEVSVTGSEYPNLFDATADVGADMFLKTASGGVVVIQAKDLTSRPTGRRSQAIAYLIAGSGEELFSAGAATSPIPQPPDETLAQRHLSVAQFPEEECIYLAVEGLRARSSDLLTSSEELWVREEEESRQTQSLLELADEVQAIPVDPPPLAVLSGNLTRDVLELTGLTAAELANAINRTERSVRGWVANDRVPTAMRPVLQQLRTIALRLFGGLGSAGVRRWLTAGDPSALSRIAAGDAAGVLAETSDLLDSPAT